MILLKHLHWEPHYTRTIVKGRNWKDFFHSFPYFFITSSNTHNLHLPTLKHLFTLKHFLRAFISSDLTRTLNFTLFSYLVIHHATQVADHWDQLL